MNIYLRFFLYLICFLYLNKYSFYEMAGKRKRVSLKSKIRKNRRRNSKSAATLSASRGFSMSGGSILSNVEKKFFDNSISAATFMPVATSTWAFSLLNGIIQGTDATQRVGRMIKYHSITVRFSASAVATTAGLPDKYRVVIVYDRQNNAAVSLPTPTDVFTDNAVQALNNLDNRARFVILLDKYFFLGPASTANGGVPTVVDKVWHLKNVKDLSTVYNGSGATIGTIVTGSLFMGVCGHGGLLTAAPSGVVKVRLRYSDA